MKDDSLKIGVVLKKLIQKHKTSIRRLSLELDIPATTIFNYCQNTMPRRPQYLLKLCIKFNITTDELLFDTPRNENNIRCGDVVHGTFKIIRVEKAISDKKG